VRTRGVAVVWVAAQVQSTLACQANVCLPAILICGTESSMPSERHQIQRRRHEFQEQLRALSVEPLMRGSVYQRRRRCGRRSCACAKTPTALHRSKFLTVFLDGRTRGFHLRAEDQEWAEKAVAAYNRLWQVVNALTACEVAELRRQIRERQRARTRRQ